MSGSAVKIPVGDSTLKTLGKNRIRMRRFLNGDSEEVVDVRTSSGAAKLEEFDILTADGVVHAIDTVIL